MLDLGTSRVVDAHPDGPWSAQHRVRPRPDRRGHSHGARRRVAPRRGDGRGAWPRSKASTNPGYSAAHPEQPLAYVTDSAREEVVVLTSTGGACCGARGCLDPLGTSRSARTARPCGRPSGRRQLESPCVDTADPRRPRLGRTFAPPFLAHDVVFSPDGRTVWVTSGSERRLALYDGTHRPRRVLEAGSPPQHVAFAHDKAFVANGDDGTVARCRLDGELVREARVPVGSYNVTFGWGRIVSPSLGRGTVSVLDRNGRVEAVRSVARAAHDACIVFGP